MTAYLLFIGLVFILLAADSALQRKGYGLFTLIALTGIILFTVLRFETGYDYLNYVGFLNTDVVELVNSRIEWGFVGITALFKLLDLDYFWLFFSFGIAIVLSVFRGIKLYTTHVRIALLIFLLIPGLYLNSFSIIRQSLAIALLFNGYYYLWNKRYACWWAFALSAVLFHYSSLLVIPFFWLATKLEKRAKLLLLAGVPLSLFLAQINVVGKIVGLVLGSSKFAGYLEAEDAGTSMLKLVVLNLFVLIYLVFYKRLDAFNRSVLVLVVLGLMLTNVFSNIGAITRIGYYFKIFEIVLLANLVPFIKRGWSQLLFYLIVITYFFLMFYSALSFDYNEVKEYPKLTPYKTIFER